MKDYVTGYFYGVGDREGFAAALAQMLKVAPSPHFFGDNLITFHRNLSFLSDQPFMAAFEGAEPNAKDRSIIWRSHVVCWAAKRALQLGGDLVEAACYRGFTARVVYDALQLRDSSLQYWLYDAFDSSLTKQSYDDPGDDLYDRVVARFSDAPNVRILRGRLPESLAAGAPERIGFMHIDMNDAESELAVLDALFDRVIPGAFIVLDDYGWDGYVAQKVGADWFFQQRGLQVLELPTGQGLVIK
jgi:O-methyltransferase